MDPELYAMRRINGRLTTSGRLIPADLDALAAIGVDCIVNLAPDGVPYAMADEPEACAARSLDYVHIPVDFAAPSDADFVRFAAAMKALADRTLHIHCIANWRVSAFLYRYRRDVLGEDEAMVRADMEALWRPDATWQAFLTPPPPSYPPAPAI